MSDSAACQRTEIVILGTIHSCHFRNGKYSAARVNEILLALEPAAICVELYSRFFNDDGSLRTEIFEGSDCPEILATNDAANHFGIRQIPFDIEGRNEFFQETRYFARECAAGEALDRWTQELQSSDERHPHLEPVATLRVIEGAQRCYNHYAPPEAINSAEFDEMIEMKNAAGVALTNHCAQYPQLAEHVNFWRLAHEYWNKRNTVMVDNLLRAASQFPGSRLAVVTGCEHRYFLRRLLSKEPTAVVKEFWEL